jgi:DNA helicase-2/ATP-dependent DNA helicase PcrA
MPEQPYQQSITGTEFHGWLERQFGQGIAVDIDSLTDDSDASVPEGIDISNLQETFARSQWAGRKPEDVEIEIQVAIERNIFICKLDAVFATDDGFQIVDWKTGKAPETAEDEEAKALQLALYRMAYSRYKGIDPSKISCALYFVTDDRVLEPSIKSEAEIIELWQSVLAKVQSLNEVKD